MGYKFDNQNTIFYHQYLQIRKMPCTHCGLRGHNIITCSSLGAEDVRRNRREQADRRQRERREIEQRAQAEALAAARRERNRQMPSFHIFNDNNYCVSIYCKRLTEREGETASNDYSHWADIQHFGQFSIRQDTPDHHLFFLPTEVCLNGTHRIPKDHLTPEEIEQLFTITDLTTGKNHIYQRPNNELYLIKDFTPKKNDVQQWKECGLKSIFLLSELVRLGADKNDNYAAILDLIQDITIPPHEQIDRENAGIPSAFTNITTETGINPPE